jgi:hypothetical protein
VAANASSYVTIQVIRVFAVNISPLCSLSAAIHALIIGSFTVATRLEEVYVVVIEATIHSVIHHALVYTILCSIAKSNRTYPTKR